MILRSFQVRNYKNVRCSGEVTVEDGTTCLVGKNESGKSALLQALYRLNPVSTGHPDTFAALRDYPRRDYAKERDQAPAARPITATFELDDEDLRIVEKAHGRGVLASRLVTASRTYENELVVELDGVEEGSGDTGDEDGPGGAARGEAEGAALPLGEGPGDPAGGGGPGGAAWDETGGAALLLGEGPGGPGGRGRARRRGLGRDGQCGLAARRRTRGPGGRGRARRRGLG